MTEFAMRSTPEQSSTLPAAGESMLVEGAARRALADFSKFFSKERLQQEAVRDERTRLARDLHDGVLQALTGAALQLEAASLLIATDPDAARVRIQAVGDLIATEQRELRLLIQRLKPAAATSGASVCELGAALEQLRDRIGQQWPLRIQLVISGRGGIPRALGDNVYSIVQEGLANVARHAVSSGPRRGRHPVRQSLHQRERRWLRLPFHGRFDLAALIARELGPVSLRERVAALRGELILTSSVAGSSLEITLPLGQDAMFWKRLATAPSHG
jgi:signal transduction histidine kinase